MKNIINKSIFSVSISIACLAASSTLQAGGFSRNGDDIDLLFRPGNRFEATTTFVEPERSFTNIRAVDRAGAPSTSGPTSRDPTLDKTIPRITAKFEINPAFDCMLAYREPFGFELDYGNEWVGRYKNTRFNVETESLRGVCSYKKALDEASRFRIIGGVGAMRGTARRENYVANAVLQPLGLPAAAGDAYNVFDLDDSDTEKTWQAGVAYEVPKKAIRASLMYNSKSDVKLHGTQLLDNPLAGTLRDREITGTLTWPESVELKVQSGIKPGWLALGSIKWENWSDFYEIPVYSKEDGSQVAVFTAGFRDGLTVTAGVGHRVTPKLGVQGLVRWDRGTTTGFNAVDDVWGLSLGGNYQLSKQVAVTAGLAVAFASDGQAETTAPVVNYDYDDDVIYAIRTGFEVNF